MHNHHDSGQSTGSARGKGGHTETSRPETASWKPLPGSRRVVITNVEFTSALIGLHRERAVPESEGATQSGPTASARRRQRAGSRLRSRRAAVTCTTDTRRAASRKGSRTTHTRSTSPPPGTTEPTKRNKRQFKRARVFWASSVGAALLLLGERSGRGMHNAAACLWASSERPRKKAPQKTTKTTRRDWGGQTLRNGCLVFTRRPKGRPGWPGMSRLETSGTRCKRARPCRRGNS